MTETALAVEGSAGDHARSELEEVHAVGVRIAIDDFGTGFSSLDQLRRFPIDVIKVDRSFIQGMEHDAKSATITGNVASLAHALGLEAIAEGVETVSQLATVASSAATSRRATSSPVPPADDVRGMLVSEPDRTAVV